MKIKFTAALVGFVSAGAFAVANAGSPADYFNKIDANADGAITEAEYVAYKTADGKYTAEKASKKFAKYAGDDAQISMAEFEAAMKKSKSKKSGEKKKERSS
ncbi:hypothetical protein RYZ27_14160 [Hyphomonas sp. FCG-A18]|jgi:Ca2+-binding EF-hand superfamily protein|uniref:hypothetical protein n=1 Tax=Hyphomonas sp. FCG-A18 TaxID=3080019 RepID=UPI002B31CA05|nr:hypothetical protein RYZ27_14160 [Hyphomonas sp. FCG-A18]